MIKEFIARPYETKVIVMIGEAGFNEGRDKFENKYDLDTLNQVGPWGYTYNALDNVVIVKLKSLYAEHLPMIVHECVHAYLSVCYINGTNIDTRNQEPTAYGVSDILKEILKK